MVKIRNIVNSRVYECGEKGCWCMCGRHSLSSPLWKWCPLPISTHLGFIYSNANIIIQKILIMSIGYVSFSYKVLLEKDKLCNTGQYRQFHQQIIRDIYSCFSTLRNWELLSIYPLHTQLTICSIVCAFIWKANGQNTYKHVFIGVVKQMHSDIQVQYFPRAGWMYAPRVSLRVQWQ